MIVAAICMPWKDFNLSKWLPSETIKFLRLPARTPGTCLNGIDQDAACSQGRNSDKVFQNNSTLFRLAAARRNNEFSRLGLKSLPLSNMPLIPLTRNATA